MRISTTWQQQLTLSRMLDQQSKLADTQLKMSTGQKYLTAAEDPQAAASLIDFNQQINVYQQYQSNIVIVRQRLQQENSSIDSGISVVQSIRDLAVQGLNASNQGANRAQIADQIDQLTAQLINIANTQNANGEYIFSGYQSDQRTYLYDKTNPPDTVVTYQGDPDPTHQRVLTIGSARQMADGDSGESVFGAVTAGQPAGSIANVFQAVKQLSDDLRADHPSTASLKDLDNALDRMSSVQVTIGARLNALDVQDNLNADYILDHKKMVSEVGDLDYAEASSTFNLQQIALQASQQAYVKVKDLSLFKYL